VSRVPKLRIVLLATLGILVALVVGDQVRQYLNHKRNEEVAKQILAHVHRGPFRPHGVQERRFTNAADLAIPIAYPRPASPWITSEQHFYEQLLNGKHYEVLVAPFQVDGNGFDRATRLLMTEELSAAIERAGLGKVADPYVMWKVFGAGRRAIDVNDIYRIANLVGARRVIWGAAGQEGAKKMHLKVVSQELNAAQSQAGPTLPTSPHSFDDIAIGAENSPLDAFEANLPALLSAMGIHESAASAAIPAADVGSAELPATPLTLFMQSSNPQHDAAVYALLYALTPAQVELTREYFAVRAYLASAQLARSSEDYRLLRARSLMMLGYRPAALRTLGSPQTPDEQELLAVLNGNLPEARSQAAKSQNPLLRLIERLDITRMAQDYGVLSTQAALEDIKQLGLPGQVWPFLAARAASEADPWAQYDDAALKGLLDHEFPDKGYSLQDLVTGQVAQGNPQKLRSAVELSVFNHARHVLAANAGSWCCDMPASAARPMDYLALLSGIADDNLIRRVNFEVIIQREPAEALRDADGMLSVYRGNPYYELARARAEEAVARGTEGAERAGLFKSAYEDAFNAMFWEQGQSKTSSDALNEVATIAMPEFGYFDNFYARDWPHHPGYMIWGGGGDPNVMNDNGQAALDNATSQFSAVDALAGIPGTPSDRVKRAAEVIPQLEGRFVGDPERNLFLAEQQQALGQVDAARTLLRDNVRDYPQYRASYLRLGELEFSAAHPTEAVEVYRSFPGLKPGSSITAVERSNIAYDMGNLPYGSGDLELAKPFLRIAAAQASGSASSLEAATRLQLLEGDTNGALASSLERAQRYNNDRAYRDYLAILYAEKRSEEAWSAFNTLAPQLDTLTLWQSALVGHHLSKASEEQVSQWVQQGNLQHLGNEGSFAATYLAMFATMDRIPSEHLASAIEQLDRPVWQFEDGPRYVVRADAEDPLQHILGPASAMTQRGVLPIGAFDDPHKHRVRPAMAFYVEGYRALKLGDFKAAMAAFGDATAIYDLATPQLRYMLPYLALAVGRTGADDSAVTSILGRFAKDDQGFDYYLAAAVLTGLKGNSVEALHQLKLARYRRTIQTLDDRPALSQFTYGDICELLYQQTRDVKYRDEALDWARTRERAEPWHSWSYALEAALAPDLADRQRALAMLEYLDPGSSHLAGFKRQDIDDAVKRFAGLNPFRPQPARSPKRQAT
jgi:hypothetical protein